ncbi:histidine triad nucleotide-binding protein [Nocardioides solisilvae]|uniref:histidine triad nucleotide-binding protein n=1 Tax=Nocardioides solisilvae TaxID=1542435 RepID=UPI000D748FB8|nr:histidine triad nucleotide-binding protein [Nocardioides solisilvae]
MSSSSDPGHTGDCLFCRLVAGDVPAEVVEATDRSVAFRDVNPQAPTHVLVVPRAHHANAVELATGDPEALADVVRLADSVAEAEGLAGDYRLVFNTGAGAGQTVFHTHLHVLGGRPFTWPPG